MPCYSLLCFQISARENTKTPFPAMQRSEWTPSSSSSKSAATVVAVAPLPRNGRENVCGTTKGSALPSTAGGKSVGLVNSLGSLLLLVGSSVLAAVTEHRQ